jgi:hypothetical protein
MDVGGLAATMRTLAKVFLATLIVIIGIPLMTLAGIAINSHYFAGLRQVISSPDGKSRVYVRYNTRTAGPNEYVIAVQSGLDPFRHTVFGADDNGGDVSVHWYDATHLVVSCQRCERMDIFETRSKLGRITITVEHR